MNKFKKNEYLAIAKIIAYADVFSYPLLEKEIRERCQDLDSINLPNILAAMVDKKLIHKIDDFYLLNFKKELVDRRKIGNQSAKDWLPVAKSNGYKLVKFPFVKGVFLSGSISKDYMDVDCDVDYFIVAKHKRIWLAHASLFLYRKIFFNTNPQLLCMNYFVDEKYLEIPYKNYYTAFECVSVKPLFSKAMYHHFLDANDWARTYFPLYPLQNQQVEEVPNHFIKKIIEATFNNFLGDILENLIFKFQRWRIKRLYSSAMFAESSQNINLTKHSIKIHTGNYFKKVTTLLEEKMQRFNEKLEAVYSEI
ncbi:hypothetical protein ACQKCH_14835 [Nubsella zeaxanthinifaciens]|uniref:hypothetical protein n=1 Tax=Nubsella zeaxanthinifaciens TaxID=392412 RepID=UPI003D060E3D